MAAVWGPFSQANNSDARWHISCYGAGLIILMPSALTPDTVIRSHDPGMYQPRLDRPCPYPDYFTSVVIERASTSSVQFYLVGK